VFEASEAAIEFQARGDTEFVLGSAVPHPYELNLGTYSVHTKSDALHAAESLVAQIQARLISLADVYDQTRNSAGRRWARPFPGDTGAVRVPSHAIASTHETEMTDRPAAPGCAAKLTVHTESDAGRPSRAVAARGASLNLNERSHPMTRRKIAETIALFLCVSGAAAWADNAPGARPKQASFHVKNVFKVKVPKGRRPSGSGSPCRRKTQARSSETSPCPPTAWSVTTKTPGVTGSATSKFALLRKSRSPSARSSI